MNQRLHKLWPTWAIVVGCFLLFVGERIYAGNDDVRLGLAVACAVAIAAAVVVRLNEFLSAETDKKPVARYLMLATVGLAFALVDYAMIVLVFDGDGAYHERWRGVLWGVWPALFVVSAFPLIAMEIAVSSVAFNHAYETARVRQACLRGLSLGLFLGALAFANYIAAEKDEKIELSASNTTKASDETKSAVRDLTKEVRVLLFYPRSNEVAETLQRFFEPLAASNPKLTVERVDHALAGEVAKEAGVTENGYVALVCDKAKEKIRIGTKPRSARSSLRRFNGSFLKSLAKVTTQKRVAYIVTGHDERATKNADKEDKRSPAKVLKRQLEAWQFTVKNLGLAEGLGDELPKDDGVIFVLGPEKPFLDAEIQTLLEATDHGVRMFIALESERDGDGLDGLLNPLGVKFDKTRLANMRYHAPLTRTARDVTYIATNRYTSHESVTTMTRNARDLPTLFDRTGSLSQVKDNVLDRTRSELVVKAMDDTFQDANTSNTFDDGEKKDRFGLAAAITRTSTTGKKDDEARIYVLADADAVMDEMLKTAQANIYLFRDAVAWLQRAQDPVVPTVTEKDVKIVHRKEDDSLIFLGTTVLAPAVVLLLGFYGTRRRRR